MKTKYKLIGLLLFALSFTIFKAKAKNNKFSGIVITCPSGDRYRCYSDPDIGEIKKGEGDVTIDNK